MIKNEDAQLIHGDCLDVLKGIPDNSVDSIVTDPPYGLTDNIESFDNAINRAFHEVMLPDFNELESKCGNYFSLDSVLGEVMSLNAANMSGGVKSAVAVPESTVNLKNHLFVNQEVEHTDKLPSDGISAGVLPDVVEAKDIEISSDFILKPRDAFQFSAGDCKRRAFRELSPGRIGMLVVVPSQSGCGCFFSTFAPCFSGIFGDDVRSGNCALTESRSPSSVMALHGAKRIAILSLDLGNGTFELLPANSTGDLSVVFEILPTQLIRASSAASSLSSKFKAVTFSSVEFPAIGAVSFNLHKSLLKVVNKYGNTKGFMGKGWDKSVPSQAIWEECLRVLKPGGHLLAFAGTRTQHRMAVRIEDAGFEIRDMIAWVYGSGFPKSMDVSKAIDKMDASHARRARQLRFTEWVRSTGLTSAEIDRITETNMGSHYTTAASQPAVATREHFEKLRPHFGVEVPEWVEQLVDERTVESENFKKREVVGKAKWSSSAAHFVPGEDHTDRVTLDITAPATDAAKQWQGWGTALKPALEPITVARKPFKGTVAANVLEWGTGAINIDECRVGPPIPHQPGGLHRGSGSTVGSFTGETEFERDAHGRWPANLIHDGRDEPTELLGAAARFFYCAKASKKDRGDGNTHPTVKPTDLMAYLCRLVTPPGGVVLDPFMGSGSTGKAAIREGFRFIGIEMDADYLAIAEARIANEAGKQPEK